VRTLAKSPVVFVGGLVTALVVAPQTGLGFVGQFLDSPLGGVAGLLGNLFSLLTFFVTPLIAAGTLGMAREALDEGATSLGTFRRVGTDRYLPLLVAFLLRVGIAIVLGLAALVVVVVGAVVAVFVVGVGPNAGGGIASGVGAGALAVAAVTVLVAALVFYGPLFFLQFFHVAVATDGAGAVEGYGRSYRLVRANLLSTLGYSVVTVAVSLLVVLPPLAAVGARLAQVVDSGPTAFQGGAGPGAGAGVSLFSPVEVVLFTVGILALQVVVTPFQYTYARAFYDAVGGDPRSDSDSDPDPGPETGTETDDGGAADEMR
jgi:hypothetical protein